MSKRPRVITDWLKKEENNYFQYSSKENSNINQAEDFKKSLRICLEPIDNNIIHKEKEIKEQSKSNDIRRTTRSCQAIVKKERKSVEREQNIEDLPPILFKGQIKYTCDFYEFAEMCDTLLTEVENNKDEIVPIGFDLEWPFSFQTGSGKTALAQICLTEKLCYLVHVYKFKQLPKSFILLLSHSKVKIVGVNIKNDIRKLARDFKDFPDQKVVNNNCLDCGPYANIILNRTCRWSLEKLTACLLQKRISKDPSVRRSKWHIQPLSNVQKLYAATDAYVSLLLYLTITKRKSLCEKEKE